MAHLYADGSLLGGGEREVTVGLEYAVSPARLPATASYLALGHIHRPQRVAGTAAPGRYSGSLLQLDFGETEQQKSVVDRRRVAGQSRGDPRGAADAAVAGWSTCAGRSMR